MSISHVIVVHCDWPGCERVCRTQSETPGGARVRTKAEGWDRMAGLDFCMIHPRHVGHFIDGGHGGFRMYCATCSWVDEGPNEPKEAESQYRWIAHLRVADDPAALGCLP